MLKEPKRRFLMFSFSLLSVLILLLSACGPIRGPNRATPLATNQ